AVGRVPVAPLLLAEIRLGVRTAAAVVHFPGPHMLLEILHRIEHGTGFEKSHVDAEIGENFNRSSAAGTGADYNNIMHRGCALDLKHGFNFITAQRTSGSAESGARGCA